MGINSGIPNNLFRQRYFILIYNKDPPHTVYNPPDNHYINNYQKFSSHIKFHIINS